ncbi:hypothetical protein MKW94_007004, partial [Papaver nudicaule]|nr:hypothetical protein [Papaver nudicaule]
MGCFSKQLCIIFFFLMFIISVYHDQIIIAQAQDSNPNNLASTFCLGTNYTANSTYQTNLMSLLSSLSSTFTITNNNTIPQYGYRNITLGANPDTVYGSLHCREDITPDECSGCACNCNSVMFRDGCVLRYSDENYFSIMSAKPGRIMRDGFRSKVTEPQFVDIVTGLLYNLMVEAVSNTSISPCMYATGLESKKKKNLMMFYAMVQCTPDLTPSLCRTCLRSAIRSIPTCCSDRPGARILFPSCTFRYEANLFYGNYMHTTRASTLQGSPPTALQLAPSSTTNSNGKDSSKLLISIAIPLLIAVLLSSSIAVWWFCFHKRKKINNNYF